MRNMMMVSFFAALSAFGVSAITDTSNTSSVNAQYGCSGQMSASSGLGSRLFPRIAQRRATRIQSRSQTGSCSGGLMNQQYQQQNSCSGMMNSYQVQPQQYYVPAETVSVQTQTQPQYICDGVTCTLVQQPQQSPVSQVQSSVNFAPIQTTKSFAPIPKQSSQSQPVLFGLSAYEPEAESIPKHVLAQIDSAKVSKPVPTAIESFRGSLIKAISDARKSGKINFRDSVKLRVACMSPAFVEKAQELAVTQVAFSGEISDDIPLDENGVIQVEGINWEGLGKFLETFIPLLLTLLKAFGL